jgi:hypothetical protein
VEHACRGAQGLAGGVVSVSECPCSAESVYRKRRRRRSDDGANTMGTHSSFLLWYYAIAPVTRDKLPTLVCHLVCVVLHLGFLRCMMSRNIERHRQQWNCLLATGVDTGHHGAVGKLAAHYHQWHLI